PFLLLKPPRRGEVVPTLVDRGRETVDLDSVRQRVLLEMGHEFGDLLLAVRTPVSGHHDDLAEPGIADREGFPVDTGAGDLGEPHPDRLVLAAVDQQGQWITDDVE